MLGEGWGGDPRHSQGWRAPLSPPPELAAWMWGSGLTPAARVSASLETRDSVPGQGHLPILLGVVGTCRIRVVFLPFWRKWQTPPRPVIILPWKKGRLPPSACPPHCLDALQENGPGTLRPS